ncbi:hypothetical protein [Pararhodobacter sp. CCB-MM2]|uniref:hypothetical protein n=1 Tax=Pararhodobacter sp. CCB-MM2 TaxID=1786003 RepID=UPI000834FAA7|nr:hypothetical protein [Pararhodobacter sp. CCB-MM2]
MRPLVLALGLLVLPFMAQAQSIPVEYQGQWSGEGRQRGTSSWRIDINLGPEVGVAFYPEYQCTARWVFQPDADPFAFWTASGREETVTGHDQCIDGLGLFLRIGEDGSLLVEWRGDDGIPMAIALLARG